MKITSDQLAALQLEQKNKAQKAAGDGFAQALAQELAPGSTTQSSAAAGGSTPMLRLDQAMQTAMLQTKNEQTVMEKMDSLLSKWENYSQVIGAQNGDLREGYHLLADIRQDIQAVKGTLAQAPDSAQGLQNMINELDVLTTTEEFKFNRGDYIN